MRWDHMAAIAIFNNTKTGTNDWKCTYVCQGVHRFVCQPLACPCDTLWTIQGRITKLGPVVQNTLVMIPIVLSVTDHDLIAQI